MYVVLAEVEFLRTDLVQNLARLFCRARVNRGALEMSEGAKRGCGQIGS
jgi:hypothetical protein